MKRLVVFSFQATMILMTVVTLMSVRSAFHFIREGARHARAQLAGMARHDETRRTPALFLLKPMPAASRGTVARVDARKQFSAWGDRLGGIAPNDAASLRKLKDEMKDWIHDHDDSLGPWIAAFPSDINRMPLRNSFLFAGSVIQSSANASALIQALLLADDSAPRANAADLGESKNSLVKIYALDQYQQLVQGNPSTGQAAQGELVPLIVNTAETSHDLAVVRESLKVLNAISDNPQTYWSEIQQARKPDEVFAISDLISS